jgi:hypothetical protein
MENGARDDGEVNDRKKGQMDGRTDGRTNRQTQTKKEKKKKRKTDVHRALSSHCPGRNLRMSVRNTQTNRHHHVCSNTSG